MDPRYKFVRGKPFQGLSDYLEGKSIRTKNKKIIYPVSHSVQDALFSEPVYENPEFGLRTRLGHYYELLSKSISGGALKKLYNLEKYSNGDSIKSEPDLTSHKKNKSVLLTEVKSIAPGQALKLLDNQITKYVSLQTGNYFSKCPLIKFDIFRHGITEIQKKYKTRSLEELVRDLSKTTKFMVSLPFRVIFEIYKSTDGFSGSRYEGEYYLALTRFNSSTINDLIANPEYTLEKMKINLDDLIIKKRKFPGNVFMNGVNLEPFPILIVLDKMSSDKVSEKIKREIDEDKKLSNRLSTINREIETPKKEESLFSPQILESPSF